MRSSEGRPSGALLILTLLEHPLRTDILGRLIQRPCSPTEIAADLGISVGVADYHLRQLQAAELARLTGRHRPKGRRGHPQKYYDAVPPVLSDEEWTTIPALVRSALRQAVIRELASRAEVCLPEGKESADATLAVVATDLTALLGLVTTSLSRVGSETDEPEAA